MPENLLVLNQIRWHDANQFDFPAEPISYRFEPARSYLLESEQPEAKEKLLRLLGLLEEPSSGEILLEGRRVTGLSPEELGEIRNRKFGFLFSSPFLLPAFTVLENVAMPLFKVARVDAREAKNITELVLGLIGILPIADIQARRLSVLDQHLTALARAVVLHPQLLIVQSLGLNLTGEEALLMIHAMSRIPVRLGATVIATLAPAVDFVVRHVVLEIDAKGMREARQE